MNLNSTNSKLVKIYLNGTKLIKLTIIIGVAGISSFGCQNSPPSPPKTQASPPPPSALTAGIDPADIPTLPQNLPNNQSSSQNLPETQIAPPTLAKPQTDVPILSDIPSDTKTVSPRQSKPQNISPNQSQPQSISPNQSEPQNISPSQSESQSISSNQSKPQNISPNQSELQNISPNQSQPRTLSPSQLESPTVLLTPSDTQIALLRPPKPQTESGRVPDIKNLPDGNYFYGESPESDRPGSKYIVFRKTGNLIIGQEYFLQTDNSQCFRGTANSAAINNVKTAYSEPSRDGLQWSFGQIESIGTNNLHQLGFEKAPDFATQNLQECIRVFNRQTISFRF